jgi:hypothetical protein
VTLFVTMFKDEVKVYRDVSGRSLHKRGYRGRIHKGSLNEAAAAGMLHVAGWPALAEAGALLWCRCLLCQCTACVLCLLHHALTSNMDRLGRL